MTFETRDRTHSDRPFGGSSEGGGPATDRLLHEILGNILNGPGGTRRMGGSPFGRSSFEDSLFGRGAGMGRSPFLNDDIDDDELDNMMGPGKFRMMEIGPDGSHMVGTGDISASDVRALLKGEEVPGVFDMIRDHVANPPTKGQRRLSMLRMIADSLPLALQINVFVGHAGAEIARFIMKPDGQHDFAFMQHLAQTLSKAKADDKEKFENLQKRLKAHGFNLPELIKKIEYFVEKRTVSSARSVQMRLALVGSLALALMDDVADDLKQQRSDAIELLRKTSQI